jgi:hypothetical protein
MQLVVATLIVYTTIRQNVNTLSFTPRRITTTTIIITAIESSEARQHKQDCECDTHQNQKGTSYI